MPDGRPRSYFTRLIGWLADPQGPPPLPEGEIVFSRAQMGAITAVVIEIQGQ